MKHSKSMLRTKLDLNTVTVILKNNNEKEYFFVAYVS